MPSVARRAVAAILRLVERVGDPAAVAGHVLLYVKDVLTVSQLFVRTDDGAIFQMTPFAGGAGASMLYGDGGDGNVTIAAGTTTLTKDMNYDTLTIQTGGILKPANFRVFARTAIIMQGTGKISTRGNNGTVGLQTTGGAGGTTVPVGSLAISLAGGAGTAAAGSVGATSTSAPPGNTAAGGAGGAGGSGAGGAGGTSNAITAGNGGFALALWAIQQRASGLTGTTSSPGGGGGGGAANGGGQGAIGGGGGAGGGYLVVCAPTFGSAGLVESNGGNGAACNTPTAGLGGGGGGGAGGDITIVCGDGFFPTIDSSGGTGGAGINGGGNGNAGGAGVIRRYSGV